MFRWGANAQKPLSSNLVWMEGREAITAANLPPSSPVPPTDSEFAPAATEEPTVKPMEDPLTMRTPPPEEESESPAPTPKSKPSPRSTPKATPNPTPRPTPKKPAKSSPKPSPAVSKKEAAKETKKVSVKTTPASKEAENAETTAGTGARGEGAGSASQFARYGSMLHDRFFGAWEQPTSVVASGAKMSVLVRIRIEQDGRVSDFSLVRPSGNVVVDDSVAAVAKRVTQVDPLPAGLGQSGHYEVKINFELNAE